MKLDNYQELAKEFPLTEIEGNTTYFALGLAGETGEVIDKLKKRLRGQEITSGSIALELGDVLWYLAGLADALGYSLDHIARMNLEKLTQRASNGTIKGNGDYR